jgi:hypothetical protein
MDPDRIKWRHVRDKAVIDHLADKVFETSRVRQYRADDADDGDGSIG